MIEVYSWATPNGHKVHIMLEECGLPYRVHAINIGSGDQFDRARRIFVLRDGGRCKDGDRRSNRGHEEQGQGTAHITSA